LVDAPIIACETFRLGRVEVPAFTLRPHQLVAVVLPPNTDTEAQELQEILANQRPQDGVRHRGRIKTPELPQQRSWWRDVMNRETVADWFRRVGHLSGSQAERVCESLGLPPRTLWRCLALTPRTLMGLGAARLDAPDAVVFQTIALDRLGVRDVVRAARKGIDRTAAVHVTTELRPSVAELVRPLYSTVVTCRLLETRSPNTGTGAG
jgi:hypothetical protein